MKGGGGLERGKKGNTSWGEGRGELKGKGDYKQRGSELIGWGN